MFCSNCGKPLDDKMMFCPECGAPRPVARSAEAQQPATPAPQQTAPQKAQQPHQQAPTRPLGQPYQQAPAQAQPYQQGPTQFMGQPYQQAPAQAQPYQQGQTRPLGQPYQQAPAQAQPYQQGPTVPMGQVYPRQPAQPAGQMRPRQPVQPAGYPGTRQPVQPAGYPNTQQPTQPAGYPNTQQPTQPVGYPDTQQPTQPVGYPDTQQPAGAFYGQSIPPVPPKKKKKGGVIALVVILALVAGIGAFVALNFKGIRNYIASMGSPAAYMRTVGKMDADDAAKKMTSLYATALTDNPVIAGGKSDTETIVKLSSGARELLQSRAGVDMSWLESMTIGVDFVEKDDRSSGKLSFKLNNAEILTGSFYVSDGILYGRIDQFSQDYFKMDAEDAGYVSALSGALPNKDSLPDDEAVEKLFVRYTEILLNAVNDEDVTKEAGELTEAGVTEKGTWLTADLSGDDMIAVARAILQAARDDKELFDLVNLMQSEEDRMTREGFIAEIDGALEELNNEEAGEEHLVIRYFVAKDGEVHGREIRYGEDGFVYYFPQSGGQFGFRFEMTDNGEAALSVTGSGKDNGKVMNGDLVFRTEGEEAFTVKVEKFNRAVLKDGKVIGKFTIKTAQGETEDSTLAILQNGALFIDADYDENGGKLALTVLTGDEALVTLEFAAKNSDGGEVSAVSDGKEMNEYASGLDGDAILSNLKERLKKAGMPEELLAELD